MEKNAPQSEILSTAEAATELGITVRRIQALLKAGRFVGAQKFGRDWMIPRSAMEAVKTRKPGRPKGS
jgi:excisionase family DNA binding protein